MCYCDCEPPEIYSEWTPLARKQHVCLFCRRDILAGERYHRCAGKWDGDFNEHKWCHSCAVFFEETREGGCFCFDPYEFWDTDLRDIEGYAQPINLQSSFNVKRKEPVAA